MTSQQMSLEAEYWFLIAFPFMFLGVWTLVSIFLGFLSGWFSLQEWYADDGIEEPLLTLRWQSGSMGLGVNFGNCLTLAAKPKGLSIRLWRLFGPFQRPLLIPWREIKAEPKRLLFFRMVRLSLGSTGSLKIREATWNRLLAAAGSSAKPTSTPA